MTFSPAKKMHIHGFCRALAQSREALTHIKNDLEELDECGFNYEERELRAEKTVEKFKGLYPDLDRYSAVSIMYQVYGCLHENLKEYLTAIRSNLPKIREYKVVGIQEDNLYKRNLMNSKLSNTLYKVIDEYNADPVKAARSEEFTQHIGILRDLNNLVAKFAALPRAANDLATHGSAEGILSQDLTDGQAAREKLLAGARAAVDMIFGSRSKSDSDAGVCESGGVG